MRGYLLLQLAKLALHPYPIHLDLPLSVYNQPSVDAKLLNCKERVRAVAWGIEQRGMDDWRGCSSFGDRTWMPGRRRRGICGGLRTGKWGLGSGGTCFFILLLNRLVISGLEGLGHRRAREQQRELICQWRVVSDNPRTASEHIAVRTKLEKVHSGLVATDVKILVQQAILFEAQLREVIPPVVAEEHAAAGFEQLEYEISGRVA